MDINEIRRYAELMREMDFTALELHKGNDSVRMERMAPVYHTPGAAPEKLVVEEAGYHTESAPETKAADPSIVEITSPMVGMFYAAPAEDADPFVQVGTKVNAGDIMCIIEAMKLMNEIVADQEGTVTEILVANGSIVEFGQPLFRLRRA